MGKPYNQPSDMWALGVILFELLTLKRPFTGANIGALVLRISQGSYDDAALGACPHPPELQWLASADATDAARAAAPTSSSISGLVTGTTSSSPPTIGIPPPPFPPPFPPPPPPPSPPFPPTRPAAAIREAAEFFSRLAPGTHLQVSKAPSPDHREGAHLQMNNTHCAQRIPC